MSTERLCADHCCVFALSDTDCDVPAVHLSKLQRLQNTAARLITFTPKFDHISPVLFKLHWLPVEYRIQYKIGLLTFKAIHFKTPQYLSNLLSIKGNNRFSLRSASIGLILEDPTCRYKVTLGDRSFRASAPKTWNALPKGIRDQTNIITFKTMLKNAFIQNGLFQFSLTVLCNIM